MGFLDCYRIPGCTAGVHPLLAADPGAPISRPNREWQRSGNRDRQDWTHPLKPWPVCRIFQRGNGRSFLERYPETQTIAPTRPRSKPVQYEVETGDAVFSIAKKYNIDPETLLWSNYDVLKDDPHSLSPGQVLLIPPTDGILYEWKEGDSLDVVARDFRASVDDILNWSGNRLDLTDPQIEIGSMVMIPGGQREFQQWVVPTYAVGRSGTNASSRRM